MKLIFAPLSIVLGLIAGTVGQLTDHGARRAFAKATGAWPGEEAPEREQSRGRSARFSGSPWGT